MGLKDAFDTMKRGGYVVRPWEEYLLRKQNEDNDRKINVNAPSSIGGCLRARYYNRTGESGEKVSARSERIFNNGTYTHMRIQSDLKEANVLLMDEVPVFDLEHNIQGHTDGIINISDGELGVIEIKSINSRGFGELKREKEEHRYQGLSYLYCIEKHRKYLHKKYKNHIAFVLGRKKREGVYFSMYQHLKGGRKFSKEEKILFQVSLHNKLDNLLFDCDKEISKVVFLYENKDTQDVKEFTISSKDSGSKEVIEDFISECDILNEDVELCKVPARPLGARKSVGECRWCSHKDKCFIL